MDGKSFLYSWCAKKGLMPVFDIRATGPRHRQRFLCEVRVDTFTYVGAGNSMTKKEAQMNASKDFINYLVRTEQIAASEVPEDTRVTVKPEDEDQEQKNGDMQQQESTQHQQKSVFQEGMGPQIMGEAYQAYGGQNDGDKPSNFTYMDRMQQQKNVEEAEDLDINASLHGNWTMENAKSKLHQFLQINKINTDYIFKAVGPDHTRFVFDIL